MQILIWIFSFCLERFGKDERYFILFPQIFILTIYQNSKFKFLEGSCSSECLRKSKLTEVMLYRRGDGGAFERFPVHRSEGRHWFPQILEPVVPALAARGGGGLATVPEED